MIKVGDTTYPATTSSATTSKTASTENGEQFMSLLLAQLTNQNPLEPMDDTQMVSQMVSMNSLEELKKISEAMTAMTKTSQFTSATTLMDKSVTYLNSDNEEVSGTVSAITMGDTDVYLTVDDVPVALSSLVSVNAQTE